MDHSKIAQAQRVVGDIRKQLAVAEHVLAHEAKFTQAVPIDTVNEKDLLAQVDEHLGNSVAMNKDHQDHQAEPHSGN
jgi:hypothetical protein